jgi:hypothetical protein
MYMTLEQLKERAPAIFHRGQSERLSAKYQQVPTADVIEELNGQGWIPTFAIQKRGLNSKHMVRFRHKDATSIFRAKAEAAYPEIVLVNSHNGSCSYQLYAGVHVMACMNGMITSSERVDSVRLRHTVYNRDDIRAAAESIGEQSNALVRKVRSMRERSLTPEEALKFARAAIVGAYGAESPIPPEVLLAPRRESDARSDLWTTLNVVQENLLAGGTSVPRADGRMRVTRATRDINVLVRANRMVWNAAEQFMLN